MKLFLVVLCTMVMGAQSAKAAEPLKNNLFIENAVAELKQAYVAKKDKQYVKQAVARFRQGPDIVTYAKAVAACVAFNHLGLDSMTSINRYDACMKLQYSSIVTKMRDNAVVLDQKILVEQIDLYYKEFHRVWGSVEKY